MSSESSDCSPKMTNLNIYKFTRRKEASLPSKVDFEVRPQEYDMRPEEYNLRQETASSSKTMDTDEARRRDEPTNRLSCGRSVSSVIRLLCDSVFNYSLRAECFVIVLLLVSMVNTASAESSIGHVDDKLQNYLMNFGYLPKSDNEAAGSLRTEDQLREAIKTLQEFGNIPVTGKIDRETKELLKKPRCGLPDIIPKEEGSRWKRFTQQGQLWNHTDLTWSLQKKPRFLDTWKVRNELARALSVWSNNSRLTFKEINSDKADIVVSFVKGAHDDGYPFDGRGQILAHAFFPGSGRGGDAHFDEEEIWLMSDAGDEEEGTSLFAVAAHEFGHSLGLSHSSVLGALMYPWYQGNKYNFQLPDDDRLGIQHMYGVKEDRMWGRIPANFPTARPRPTTTTTEKPVHRAYWPRKHPEYPVYYPRPTTRPTPPPYYPRHPEKKPEHPRQRPDHPVETPYFPRRPETPVERYPNNPVTTTTARTHYNPSDRRPYHHPDRRTHYPESKHPYPDYPGHRPDNPHHPHVTRRPWYPQPTENPHNPHHPKPEAPRKPHHPKKPVYPQKPHRPETRNPTQLTPPSRRDDKIPDTCNMNYDAIALIRGEVFIFKSQYLWRIGEAGLVEGFPALITRMWSGLPENLTHVDAVYERPDRKIVFFIGKQYYLFDTSELMYGYPRPITDFGLPETLEHLNAAMVWGHNGKTYFYNETMYWKFDEDIGKVELDYPRDMSMWRGVGYDIDTVFQWKDGKTYFFKGKGFWKFNDLLMRVENEKQQLSAPFWMGCRVNKVDEDFLYGKKEPYKGLPPSPTGTLLFASANMNPVSVSLMILCASVLFLFSIDLT